MSEVNLNSNYYSEVNKSNNNISINEEDIQLEKINNISHIPTNVIHVEINYHTEGNMRNNKYKMVQRGKALYTARTEEQRNLNISADSKSIFRKFSFK